MADHKVKLLLDAVETALSALPTIGPHVERTRGYPLSVAPSVSIRLAGIDSLSEVSNAFLDSSVVIETVYHVAGTDKDLDDSILVTDSEVYAAMMVDRTQGGACIDTDPESLSVESNAEAEVPTASAIRRWRFRLRHSIGNATL